MIDVVYIGDDIMCTSMQTHTALGLNVMRGGQVSAGQQGRIIGSSLFDLFTELSLSTNELRLCAHLIRR